jgi:hypothetical protein
MSGSQRWGSGLRIAAAAWQQILGLFQPDFAAEGGVA